MNVLPVIARELQTEARRSSTYWLRTAAAAALGVVAVWIWLGDGLQPARGAELFGRLHQTLFVLVWVLVPLMTADCISREKRQGTIGLLFLTPLKALDIVLAKGMAHGMRGLTVCLGVLPVLVLPLLMGGVSGLELVISGSAIFSSLCWALAAGLLASAWCGERVRTLAVAMIFSGMLCYFMVLLTAAGVAAYQLPLGTLKWQVPGWNSMTTTQHLGLAMTDGWILLTAFDSRRSEFLTGLPPSAQSLLAWLFSGLAIVSALGFVVVVRFAASRLRRSWQPKSPSTWQLHLERILCTPIAWVSLLKAWMRRSLERNPVGWLERRTWSGRLVTWSWLAVLVSFYSGFMVDFQFFMRAFASVQTFMAFVLALSLASAAAGSFRRERETGVLELLLVSPLSEWRIIKGRLLGLWGQFLPAIGLLFAVWLYLAGTLAQGRVVGWLICFAVIYATLPVVGLYFSLRCRSPVAAFLWTLFIGLILPVVEWREAGAWALLPALLQLGLAACCADRLYRNLRGRKFALGAADG
jgi:ABC-type transport system involved in multi-copper enzyme maturation permease subunit